MLGILHIKLKKQKCLPFLESQPKGKKMKINKSQPFGINSAIKEATRYFCHQKNRASVISLLCGNLIALEYMGRGRLHRGIGFAYL